MKWGVLGAGNLMRRVSKSFAAVKGQGVELYAIGAHGLESAKEKAERFGAQKYYGSYEELLADPEVDVVYIPTRNPFHKDVAIQALNAGKPVLLEKPFTINAEEAQAVVDCARKNDVFLLEAMWTRYLPVNRKVKEWVDGGYIGEVKQIFSDFGYPTRPNPNGRLYMANAGGGALYDIGIYCLSYSYYIMGGKDPVSFSTSAEMYEPTDVDVANSTILTYDTGATALFTSSLNSMTKQQAVIYGTQGMITVEAPFWKATKATMNTRMGTYTCEFVPKEEGFEFELLEVERCLKAGLKESPAMPLDETVRIMKMNDKLQAAWRNK